VSDIARTACPTSAKSAKWATERKNLSLKDVAAAGGWQDTDTLLKCYQQPDNETLLAVMSEERKLHEVASGG